MSHREIVLQRCVSAAIALNIERERRRRDICAELGDPIDNTGDISPHS